MGDLGMSADHIQGASISRSTYLNRGCRCDGCKAADRHYNRYRSLLRSACVDHMRTNRPGEYEGLVRSVRAQLKREGLQ